MKNNKIYSTLIVAMLLLAIILTLTACNAKKTNMNTTNNNTTSEISNTSEISSTSEISTTASSTTGTLIKSSDGKMSLTLQAGWEKNMTLWPTAQIGASKSNLPNVIVIRKPKTNFAAGYSTDNFLTGYQPVFSALLNSPVWGQRSSITINGLSGITTKLTGKSKARNEFLVYWISVVSDKSNFYEIVGWTLESSEGSDSALVQGIMNSFMVY